MPNAYESWMASNPGKSLTDYIAYLGFLRTPDLTDIVRVSDLATYAKAADVPKAATVMPPGVAVDGDKGTTPQAFALADHTHATSVQRARLSVAAQGTPVRWTFARPYPAGTIPVCNATAENATGATQPFVVNVSGVPTNTYCDFIVFRAAAQTLGGSLAALLGAVVNVFGFAPVSVVINCQAAKATQ